MTHFTHHNPRLSQGWSESLGPRQFGGELDEDDGQHLVYGSIWGFPNMGDPQNKRFIMEDPKITWMIFGYHYFRKPPFTSGCKMVWSTTKQWCCFWLLDHGTWNHFPWGASEFNSVRLLFQHVFYYLQAGHGHTKWFPYLSIHTLQQFHSLLWKPWQNLGSKGGNASIPSDSQPF